MTYVNSVQGVSSSSTSQSSIDVKQYLNSNYKEIKLPDEKLNFLEMVIAKGNRIMGDLSRDNIEKLIRINDEVIARKKQQTERCTQMTQLKFIRPDIETKTRMQNYLNRINANSKQPKPVQYVPLSVRV